MPALSRDWTGRNGCEWGARIVTAPDSAKAAAGPTAGCNRYPPRMSEASIDRRLTSKDIARLAGVSQTTVSRVLQGSSAVKPKTREQVLAVIRSQNYHPSAPARWMKTSRTNSIAVVVARLSNPLYPLLLHHVSEELRNQGLLMSVWESIPGFEDRLLKAIGEGAVDGVLSATATERDAPLLKDLRQQRPVVLLNRTLSDQSFDQVSSDNQAGAAMVAEHFLKQGRKRPALITGPIFPSTIREREQGYRDMLASAGIALQDTHLLRAKDFTYRCGYEAAQALAVRAPQSDCIFCTNDVLATAGPSRHRAM